MTNANRQWLGGAFWAFGFVALASWLIAGNRSNASKNNEETGGKRNRIASPAALMVDSLWSSTTPMEVRDPTGIVRVGDVVFAEPAREVGYVTAVRPIEDAANVVTIAMFEPDVGSSSAVFTVHRNSGRLGDVLTTLMPGPKREELQRKIAAALEAHADAVTRELVPLVMQSIRASVPLIESGIVDAIERHDREIEGLVARYREEIVNERIVPLVRTEVMPIVRKHGQEPAEAIGREVWNRASLFRFGWRVVYDRSPLPERELVAEEWQRFVDEEVVPIVEDNLDEIAAAVEGMVQDLAANERLRSELSAVVGTIASDPEARKLFGKILREGILENKALQQAWMNVWSSPEAKERLRRAGERIEPILRELGDELMGTRQDGIEPGFARVLRNQILAKDRTWITITSGPDSVASPPILAPHSPSNSPPHSPSNSPSNSPPIILRRATQFTPYPVIHVVPNLNHPPP